MENEAKFVFMPAEHYKAACDKIRECTGQAGSIKSDELAGQVEKIYNDGQSAAGKWSEIEALLEVAPFLRKPITYIDEETTVHGYSGFLVGKHDGYYNYVIVLPWVTELGENSTDDFWYCDAFIFTSTIPPIINPQGLWESWGGNNPPEKIFVPDASVNAYKSATNLAEFADLIYPLSQYDGEGYYGGLYNG